MVYRKPENLTEYTDEIIMMESLADKADINVIRMCEKEMK